ncbi:MAG: IclR family transcriptional regulator [Solirubrobacterales bacterium]
MAEEEVKYQVPAVVGAISVLKELSGLADQGATQSDLVASTGVSKSTMHNLLSTLEAHDFVRREPHTRMYRLGPALIPLGVEATRQVKLVRTTTERLAPLAREHNLSFAIAQRTEEREVRIITRFYPPGDVHVGITVGSTFGPMDGALGKVLLASMDDSEVKKIIKAKKLPAHTESTITSPESLIADVAEVRSRGWSTSFGELNENNAVATGIWGASGDLELILLALGFGSQMDEGRLEAVGEVLCRTADSVMAEAGSHRPAAINS